MRLALLSALALMLLSRPAVAAPAAPAKASPAAPAAPKAPPPAPAPPPKAPEPVERPAEPAPRAVERASASERPLTVSTASDATMADGTAAAAGAKGIVFGVTDLPTVGGFLYISPADSLRLNLGVGLLLKPSVEAAFSLDAAFRHHITGGTLRPYAEGGIQFAYDGDVDFALKAGLGAEYFIVPRVSVAGTLGLALRFDNGGRTISLPFGTTGLLMNVFF
jgi:hypothetical protein